MLGETRRKLELIDHTLEQGRKSDISAPSRTAARVAPPRVNGGPSWYRAEIGSSGSEPGRSISVQRTADIRAEGQFPRGEPQTVGSHSIGHSLEQEGGAPASFQACYAPEPTRRFAK